MLQIMVWHTKSQLNALADRRMMILSRFKGTNIDQLQSQILWVCSFKKKIIYFLINFPSSAYVPFTNKFWPNLHTGSGCIFNFYLEFSFACATRPFKVSIKRK